MIVARSNVTSSCSGSSPGVPTSGVGRTSLFDVFFICLLCHVMSCSKRTFVQLACFVSLQVALVSVSITLNLILKHTFIVCVYL